MFICFQKFIKNVHHIYFLSFNIYADSRPHSIAPILFILDIHGILITSCLTRQKVSKSLYGNFDKNIAENKGSSK